MEVHTLVIDSRDRDFSAYPSPGYYKLTLPKTYYNVTNARLISAEIPLSFYQFSSAMGNTTFDILIGSTTYTITITDGNYSFASLKVELESVMTIATGLQWTVLFDTITGTTRLFNTGPTEFSIIIGSQETPVDWGLLYYLGFEADATYTSTLGSLTSPGLAIIFTTQYILLDIEELYGIDEGALYGGVVGRRPFAKIPINPMDQGYAILNTSDCLFDNIPQKPCLPRLDTIRVRFRYHNNNIIDFHGVNHSFTIRLESRSSPCRDITIKNNPKYENFENNPNSSGSTSVKLLESNKDAHIISVLDSIRQDISKRSDVKPKTPIVYILIGVVICVVVFILIYINKRSAV
ncbi:hypothetical protein ATCVOR07043_989R [Acanthocystis turfacea Chlorella virus OR0704.3]|nr:hypothetical protein ATCVOR07043_989R [Acanthocystis turfacea Chlorella virus OR0704.3]